LDAFSEILGRVKLNGALYFTAELSAPWGISAPNSAEMAPMLAPGAPHLVIYHFVVQGSAQARFEGGPPVTLEPGDVVVFPHGDAHRLASDLSAREVDSDAVIHKIMTRDLSPLHAGGGGDRTHIVCGFMACDPFLSRPILDGLPRVFKVNARSDASGRWLENSILHLVAETASGKAGSDAMLAKISEALFVDTLRRHIAEPSDQQSGWLAGARDPVVAKSLAALHSRVAHPWTIVELAQEVGISRSALVERFTRYLGEPPMSYLTNWRLQLAARALISSSRAVADIAASVGYESEAAFNRAFKRKFNDPPARYRRLNRSTADAP
jgi:AraC-like DNA-binding protein